MPTDVAVPVAGLLDDRDLREAEYRAIFNRLLWETSEKTDTAPADFRVGGRESKKWPSRENVDWWLEEGFNQTERYLDWMESHDWTVATMPDGRPGIEWDAEVVVAGYHSKLYIDAIYQTAAGELIVVDYKSGSHTPGSPEQLAWYATCLEVIFGRASRPRWGAYYMTRRGELAELIDLSPWGLDYFGLQLDAMELGVRAGLYPPSVDDHCSWCSFADYCPGVNGPRASEFPLQIGRG